MIKPKMEVCFEMHAYHSAMVNKFLVQNLLLFIALMESIGQATSYAGVQ